MGLVLYLQAGYCVTPGLKPDFLGSWVCVTRQNLKSRSSKMLFSAFVKGYVFTKKVNLVQLGISFPTKHILFLIFD